jgi:hypothetical protein
MVNYNNSRIAIISKLSLIIGVPATAGFFYSRGELDLAHLVASVSASQLPAFVQDYKLSIIPDDEFETLFNEDRVTVDNDNYMHLYSFRPSKLKVAVTNHLSSGLVSSLSFTAGSLAGSISKSLF